MKNLSIYLVAFLALSISFTSCNKDDNFTPSSEEEIINNQPQDNEKHFTYTMNNSIHTSQGIRAYGLNDVDENVVRVYGVFENLSDAMYIEIPKGAGNGTYAITEEVFALLAMEEIAYSTYWGNQNVGEVTINYEDDGTINGEFNFTLFNSDNPTETIVITDGKFDVDLRDF